MKIFWILFASLLLLNCGSNKPASNANYDYRTDEVLINFNMMVQARDFYGAMHYISREDHHALLDDQGRLKETTIQGMINLKLSTLRRFNFALDSDYRLKGLDKVIIQAADNSREASISRREKLKKRANIDTDSVNTSTFLSESDTTTNTTPAKPVTPAPKKPSVININPYEDPRFQDTTRKVHKEPIDEISEEKSILDDADPDSLEVTNPYKEDEDFLNPELPPKKDSLTLEADPLALDEEPASPQEPTSSSEEIDAFTPDE